jgi:uncharacterized protein (DUF2147 family)
MKKFLFAAAILAASPAFAGNEAGKWRTADGKEGGFLYVQIGACGSNICGTIVGAVDKDGKDDPKYQHLNKPIIWDMKADGGNAYSGGTIWAPDEDKTYASKMKLNGDVLTVSGCVLGGLVCRGQDWKRQ